MSIGFLEQYLGIITDFLIKYNAFGREILDFLYIIFHSAFNLLLFLAFALSAIFYFMSLYILNNKKEEADAETNEPLPFVTVQIPTFNELAAIRCAESCLNFSYPKDKYEILIGDDSNKPEISKKLKEFADKHSMVEVIKRESNIGYKPGNLNNMLKHSKGSIIVIFDSDFIPETDFLPRIVKPLMTDEKIAAVQARWRLINSDQNLVSALGTAIVSTCHYITIPFVYKRRKITLLCGSAEAVRKDILIKLGGWENGNLTEDIEFSLRLLEKGYRIKYLDDLECDSEVPFTLKDLYKQQMRWAYGVIYSWKKHFFSIVKSKHLNFKDKLYLQCIFLSGYFLSTLLAGLFITGALSFITHAPGPIEWGKFLLELGRNIVLTSGLLFMSIIAIAKAKKAKLFFRLMVSSFSYGLVVTYYVNIGIFKALAKIPMEWYMLNKQGNKISD